MVENNFRNNYVFLCVNEKNDIGGINKGSLKKPVQPLSLAAVTLSPGAGDHAVGQLRVRCQSRVSTLLAVPVFDNELGIFLDGRNLNATKLGTFNFRMYLWRLTH